MYRISQSVRCPNVATPRVIELADRLVVEFTAHPHGGPEALWFHFRIVRDGVAGDQRPLELRLLNFRNLLGGGRNAEQFSPVARFDDGAWQRIGRGTSVAEPDGRINAIWRINAPAKHVDLATCMPYDESDVDQLVRDTGLSRATIGVSQGGRAIERLANQFASEAEPAEIGLCFLARQHSGETPGSWVLDGLLRKLSGLNDPRLLVWAIPLTNIDGVVQGDYGKDNYPYDLNRAWGTPAMRHETLCMKHDVWRWRQRCKTAAFIDLHAPGLCETDGLYAFIPKNADPAQADNDALCATLQQSLGHLAAPNFARRANYPSRWTTLTGSQYGATLDRTYSLSIETPYSLINETPLTAVEYREAGARMLAGLIDHLSR